MKLWQARTQTSKCFGFVGPNWASAVSCSASGVSYNLGSWPSCSTSNRWPSLRTSRSTRQREWPQISFHKNWTSLTPTRPVTAWSPRFATSSPWRWAPTSSGSTRRPAGRTQTRHPRHQTTTGISRTKRDSFCVHGKQMCQRSPLELFIQVPRLTTSTPHPLILGIITSYFALQFHLLEGTGKEKEIHQNNGYTRVVLHPKFNRSNLSSLKHLSKKIWKDPENHNENRLIIPLVNSWHNDYRNNFTMKAWQIIALSGRINGKWVLLPNSLLYKAFLFPYQNFDGLKSGYQTCH